jgi:hypothetical protein
MPSPLTGPTPDPVAEALAQIYLEMDGEIRGRLVFATLDELAGDWNLQKSLVVRVQLVEALTRLGVTLDAQTGEALAAIAAQGVQEAGAELISLGIAESRVAQARFNPASIEAIARDIARQRGVYLGTIGSGEGSVLRQVDDYLRRLQTGEITKGLLDRTAPAQVGRNLREAAIDAQRMQWVAGQIDRVGTVPMYDRTGREIGRQSLHAWGRMAARTGMARAEAEGRSSAHEAAGIEVYQVNTTGSLCFICAPFEGKFFRYRWSTSPEYQRFPECPREIPLHPQCFHRLIAVPYPDDAAHPTAGELETLQGDNRALYAYQRDVAPDGPDRLWAAQHGFATRSQWQTYKRMAAREGMPIKDLRGPRWRYRGIESRRPQAIEAMLRDRRLSYKDAMEAQTRQFMRSPNYLQQRPDSLTPAAQRRAVADMLADERAQA